MRALRTHGPEIARLVKHLPATHYTTGTKVEYSIREDGIILRRAAVHLKHGGTCQDRWSKYGTIAPATREAATSYGQDIGASPATRPGRRNNVTAPTRHRQHRPELVR